MKISAIKIFPFIFMVAKTKSKHETKLNEIILLVWQGPRSQSLLGARMNSRAKNSSAAGTNATFNSDKIVAVATTIVWDIG